MFDNVFKYISVYLLSTVKFVGGPITGISVGLTILETVIVSVLGMMTTVLLFTYLGNFLKLFIEKFKKGEKTLFTSKNRKLVTIWKKYGIKGVAFLTPILFSPVVGTIVATSFRASRQQILVYMLISSIFWGFLITTILHHASFLKNYI